jgi:hypothetical protein
MPITRRTLLQGSCGAATALLGRFAFAAAPPKWQWHDVTQWGVEGRGWESLPRERYFDRLPAKAHGVVRSPVWNLSRDSAGMVVRFRTDATEIRVDYQLRSTRLAMPHMPATGVSGVDLYADMGDSTYRWVQVARPTGQHVEQTLVRGIDPALRAYMAYLPLYNGVDRLAIGVPASAHFEPLPPRTDRAVVFYGTSIMHGACASRPGMAIPALLGRRFDCPTVNLGFSGNGTMDPEMGTLMAELDPAVYCIDCLPNMKPQQVAARTGPLVHTLRAARPTTPIVLVEDRVNSHSIFFASRRKFHRANHKALRHAFDALVAAGVPNLHYLTGDQLLGWDGEATTDGSHPNDLGMVRYAAGYENVLDPLLRSAQVS